MNKNGLFLSKLNGHFFLRYNPIYPILRSLITRNEPENESAQCKRYIEFLAGEVLNFK